jgi:hypothetical protein
MGCARLPGLAFLFVTGSRSHEYNWDSSFDLGQAALQFQSVNSRHPYVQDQARCICDTF